MRRNYLDVDVREGDETDAAERPHVAVTFDGPAGLLAERLRTEDGPLAAGDVDVTFRMTEGDEPGVLAVANRHTGEYLLEANVAVDDVLALVRSVAGRDEDGSSYGVRITDAQSETTVYDKRTLLVYDAEGGLRRQDSLIPGGVEL